MVETIRTKLMQRLVVKKLDKIIVDASKCWPSHAGGHKYQIACGPEDQHVIDLQLHTCSCRKWDLTGIPCLYAVSVMMLIGERLKIYVDQCYLKTTQQNIYFHFISPIKGAKQWAKDQTMEPILPPELRRPPGRPHKNRRKEADKVFAAANPNKIRRALSKINCQKCGKPGHNKRTCKGEVGGNKKSGQNKASKISKLPVKRAGVKQSGVTKSNANGSSSTQAQQPPTTLRWMIDGSSQVITSQQSSVTRVNSSAPKPAGRVCGGKQVQSRYMDKGKRMMTATEISQDKR
ncbi:hypothetical protein PTKIN_Ptkin16aG0064700 [Pterospermum kingtungense]